MWRTLSLPWRVCLEEAWTAYCAGSIPVGAVVTDAQGKILSRGRNRVNDFAGEAGLLYGQTLAHAEINALVALPTDEIDRHTCTLYTTLEPCPLCLGAFYMSSVRQMRYAARDRFAGSVDLIGATLYLSRKPVKVTGPERADLETVLIAWSVESLLDYEGEAKYAVLEAWEAVVPNGVTLGKELHRDGTLKSLKAIRASVAEVIRNIDSLK